jgi:hypothetical protein
MRKMMLVAVLVLLGCGSGSKAATSAPTNAPASADGVPLMEGFNPGPAPENGFQIVLPIVKDIQPQGSYEYCTWTNMILDHDVEFKASQGIQTATGHHVIVFFTLNPVTAGTTRICNDVDMASMRYTAAGGAGEATDQYNQLPSNLAVHVPKGAQIVINHHYLNAGTETVPEAQSAVNVIYADPGAQLVQSSGMTVLNSAMSIPPGESTIDVNCTMLTDFALWEMLPHMHNYGTMITVDHIMNAGGTKRLFQVAWSPDMAFHPPLMTEDPSAPYVLHEGDQIDVHCTFSNTTSNPLTFGIEMCLAFGMTVDARGLGNLACDQGQWTPF